MSSKRDWICKVKHWKEATIFVSNTKNLNAEGKEKRLNKKKMVRNECDSEIKFISIPLYFLLTLSDLFIQLLLLHMHSYNSITFPDFQPQLELYLILWESSINKWKAKFVIFVCFPFNMLLSIFHQQFSQYCSSKVFERDEERVTTNSTKTNW